MTAVDQLLTELRGLGVILQADGDRLRFHPRHKVTGNLLDRLRFHPRHKVTGNLLDRLREHKPELLGILARREAARRRPRTASATEARPHPMPRSGGRSTGAVQQRGGTCRFTTANRPGETAAGVGGSSVFPSGAASPSPKKACG